MSSPKRFSLSDLQHVLAAIQMEHARELLADNLQSIASLRRPRRTTLLLRKLRSALEGAVGRQLALDEISEITWEPKSTLSDWFGGSGQPSIEAVLRLMERLPPGQRHQILDLAPVTRCYPSLEHPRISHDQVAISTLITLLRQSAGTTIVHSEREELMTFLVTAMGHSYRHMNGGGMVTGFDVHFPDWFVEVPGILYLDNLQRAENLESELKMSWDAITVGSGLLILDGVWPRLPGILEQIRELGKSRHVVVGCNTQLPNDGNQIEVPGPAHIINVLPDRTAGDRIFLKIQPV